MNAQENNLTGSGTPQEAQTPIPQDSPETQAASQETPASEAPSPAPADAGESVEQPTGDAPAEDAPAPAVAPETPTAASPAPEKPKPKYKLRQRVWGQVIRLTETKATLGIGEDGLDEGILDLIHLRDEFGNLSLSEGDGLQVYVVGLGATMKLAPSLFPPAAEIIQQLKDAHENNSIVRARVTGINRGGLDVLVEGRRAFCPFSQIEIGRCEKPEIYVNHIIDFKVTELDEEKKRIVLSHRAVLLAERDEKLSELKAKIVEGAEFEGVVMRLQPFGAFVDIGGIDGLVHVSEISFDRLNHPGEVLQKGEKVRVKVMGVSPGKDGRDRIRLSIRELIEDPWKKINEHFHVGDIVTGNVVRVTDFGAFVKLYPGIEGLLHISQYGPRDGAGAETASAETASTETAADAIPVVGNEITVRISRIDQQRRRVSLSLRSEDRPERGKVDHDASVGDKVEGVVRTVKPYGVFLDLPSIGPWVSGLLPAAETGLGREVNLRRKFNEGDKVEVEIIEIDDQGRIRLSRRSLIEGEQRGSSVAGRGQQGVSTAPPGGFNVLADALRKAQEKDDQDG